MKHQPATSLKASYLKKSLSGFSALKLQFTLTPLERIQLGPDEVKGDRWRGGFGEALRRLACAFRWEKVDCNKCYTTGDCLFHRYFFTDKPHPYLMLPELDGKRAYTKGEEMLLEILLIGEAAEHADKFVMTVEEMGRMGIGYRRGRFAVKSVMAADLVDVSEFFEKEDVPVAGCDIELFTPLKIKDGVKGFNYRNLSFESFFRLLIKRIINLNNLYCNGSIFDKEIIESEKQYLLSLADTVETKTYTEWRDFKRFSSRQHKSMKIGGLLGIIRYNGDMNHFYPYMKIGEVVGVGQHTTSGFGRYRLSTALEMEV